MNSISKQYRTKLDQLKGKRDVLQDQLVSSRQRLSMLKKNARRVTKAHTIVKEVGLITQEQLSYNISQISTMALHAVMEHPYDLKLEFVERRDRTECDIYFARGGKLIDPYNGGGGAIDVASFALRVASWSMKLPRNRNVLILDEPFGDLKGERANRKVLEMVSEICVKLGLQVIMVSDERVSREATLEAADRLFVVDIEKGISKINVEK